MVFPCNFEVVISDGLTHGVIELDLDQSVPGLRKHFISSARHPAPQYLRRQKLYPMPVNDVQVLV